MSTVEIIGAHHTPFGRFTKVDKATGAVQETKSYYELLVEAGTGAIRDSGLEAKDIEAVYLGTSSPSLFVGQDHPAPIAGEIGEALRFRPMTRVEGACASSSLAVYEATYALEAGRYRNVLVVGVEKMSLLDADGVSRTLARCSYEPEEGSRGVTFPGLFAMLARAYAGRYAIGDRELERMLAAVTALAYRNGAENPLAQFGPGSRPARLGLFSPEAILALSEDGREDNPMVAPPLRLHDCSPVSDGAAALVLSRDGSGTGSRERRVRIAGIGHAVERFPLSRRSAPHALEAASAARDRAYAEAGISGADVDFVEVHDCFTINALLCVEALGLADPGRAGHDYLAGRFGRDDRCPVNLSGGLKAKGHPVGATGASMHVLLYRQLIGDAIGARPPRQPEVGVLLNVGGAAVTNCVTVLRRV